MKKINIHCPCYARRWEAINALSSILWGYTSQQLSDILDKFDGRL